MHSRWFQQWTDALPKQLSRRRIAAGIADVALGVGGSNVAAREATPTADSQGQGFMVILHVSDPDGWPAALSNLRNLTSEFSAMRVLVVVDGGVYVFQGSNDLTAEVVQAAEAGAQVQACHNALDEIQIDPASLPDFVQVVPGGVPARVEAQRQGFRYVKPKGRIAFQHASLSYRSARSLTRIIHEGVGRVARAHHHHRRPTPPIPNSGAHPPTRHPERSEGSPGEAAARRADPTPCTTATVPGRFTTCGDESPRHAITLHRDGSTPGAAGPFPHPAADRERSAGCGVRLSLMNNPG